MLARSITMVLVLLLTTTILTTTIHAVRRLGVTCQEFATTQRSVAPAEVMDEI